MGPPADPWGAPTEPPPRPIRPTPMHGRASVPVPSASPREPTIEMPMPAPATTRSRAPRGVSWQRASRASRRSLSDGWGFSATGLLVAFCGWGVWAAAGRGTISFPIAGLVFMVVVGAAVFVLTRLLGYLVLEQTLRRRRPHARWSHFLTGLFLTAAGVSYFANTSWLVDIGEWVRTGFDWVGDWIGAQWDRL